MLTSEKGEAIEQCLTLVALLHGTSTNRDKFMSAQVDCKGVKRRYDLSCNWNRIDTCTSRRYAISMEQYVEYCQTANLPHAKQSIDKHTITEIGWTSRATGKVVK